MAGAALAGRILAVERVYEPSLHRPANAVLALAFVHTAPAGEYKVGSLAMANSGPNTNGSQFFIITGDQGAALTPNYTLFGQVSDGLVIGDWTGDGKDKVGVYRDAAGQGAALDLQHPMSSSIRPWAGRRGGRHRLVVDALRAP